jgi:HAD superfamily hydrolase (TIGR01509 family)
LKGKQVTKGEARQTARCLNQNPYIFLDAVLFSYEIGYRKPEKAAYQKALDAVGETNFSKCALADDKKRTLDAAAALGMTPVLIPTPGDFVKVIEGRFGI